MLPNMQAARDRVVEIVMFENWLRFYFIAEEGEKLLVRIPEQAMAKMREAYPKLVGLAESLIDKEIDHKTSVEAVVMFTASEVDGTVFPENMVGQVFDSPAFQLELELFGSWVQSHEGQLDAGFMEFSRWREMYQEWKKSDKVREYAAKITEAMHRTVNPGSDTTQ